MNNSFSEIKELIEKHKYNFISVQDNNEIIILFWNRNSAEKIIFGIIFRENDEYVHFGNLILDWNHVPYLGCISVCKRNVSEAEFIDNMKYIQSENKIIEKNDYYDKKMKPILKFKNYMKIINQFLSSSDYKIIDYNCYTL